MGQVYFSSDGPTLIVSFSPTLEVFTTSHNVDTTNTLTNEFKALLIVNCLFQCITRQIIDVQRIGSRIHRAASDLFHRLLAIASPPALFA